MASTAGINVTPFTGYFRENLMKFNFKLNVSINNTRRTILNSTSTKIRGAKRRSFNHNFRIDPGYCLLRGNIFVLFWKINSLTGICLAQLSRMSVSVGGHERARWSGLVCGQCSPSEYSFRMRVD